MQMMNGILKLWDGNCFDIDELVQTIIGMNGLNRHPLAAPGTHDPIWRNKTELLDIINFPTLDPGLKSPLLNLVNEELQDIPPYLDVFKKYPDLLYFLGEAAIILLSDYDDDFNTSLEALGKLNEEITKLPETDSKLILNTTNKYGKKLSATLKDIHGSCIHGGGFNLAAYYCKIYLDLKEHLKAEDLPSIHPGYFLLENINKDCIFYGYSIISCSIVC